MHIKWRDMLTLPGDRNTVLCTRKIPTQHKTAGSGVEKGREEEKKLVCFMSFHQKLY